MAHKHGARATAGLFFLGVAMAGAGPVAIAAAESGQNNSGPISSEPAARPASRSGPSRAPSAAQPAHQHGASRQAGALAADRPVKVAAAASNPVARTSIPGPTARALAAPKWSGPQPAGQPDTAAPQTIPRPAPVIRLKTALSPIGVARVAAPTPEVLRAAPNPIQQILNELGQRLSTLPATPVTDFLSGSLWLARRTLSAIESAVGSRGPGRCACGLPVPSADVRTVTSAVDGSPGSLRDVLSTAESGDVIRFSPRLRHADLALTQGALDIDVSVSIEGTGQTLEANGLSRIMVLDQSGTSISLSGLTFADGSAPGNPLRATAGGAILAEGVTLDICGSAFIGNDSISAGAADPESAFAQYGVGGAIAAYDSVVSVSNSVFARNHAEGADNNIHQQASGALGGAVFADNSEVTLHHSRFSENSASGGSGVMPIQDFPSSDGGFAAGGAVYSVGAALSATNVTFTRNSATGGDGLDGSESNPYGNEVGTGGGASGGALWVQGRGQDPDYAVPLDLQQVTFLSNNAIGGSSGAQGSAFLAGQQGGRASGGALGIVDWVAVTMSDVTFDRNIAHGGDAGANASDAGANTETGGVAQGGAVFTDSPASLALTRLSLRNNTAEGGAGGDSAPNSGTDAGEGGYSYGGAVLMTNSTGGLYDAVVIPFSLRDSELVGNRAISGRPGSGPVPDDGLGVGGLAQGGALNMGSLFESQLIGVRFVDNAAIAGQGKLASGGALINPFGEPPPGVDATLTLQNSVFRGNSVVGGEDGANPTYRESQGGGFFNNGVAVISGSRFQGNSAVGGNDTGSGHVGSGSGGAIASLGQSPVLTISGTDFVRNSAVGGRRLVSGTPVEEPLSGQGNGGAIASQNGTITINGGSFFGNQAIVKIAGDRVASGGAIDIPQPPEGYTGDLTTTAVRFTGNRASSTTGPAQGGAIAFDGSAFADNGSIFRGNRATSGRHTGSAYGGALFLQGDSQLVGSLVTGNRAHAADGYGGGVALPSGPDVLTQVQASIHRNRATTAGDDLWWPATAESRLKG